MNTLENYFNMPMSGVSNRNSATPKSGKSTKKNQKDILPSDTPQRNTNEASLCNTPKTTMDSIQTQLTEINNELKRTIKIDDIKTIIKSVVEELFKGYQEKIEKRIDQEVSKLSQENYKLQKQNDQLSKDIKEYDEALNRMYNQLQETEEIAKSASARANYNEQYSRKNNIKMHGIPENKGEQLLEVVNEILTEVGVAIEENEVMAIHRIPGQKDRPRPILVKLRNNEAKSKVMRKRTAIKSLSTNGNTGVKITDDVTRQNTELISRLLMDERITAAWYFNGSIYGQNGGRRIKFDIYDDIEKKTRKR